MPLAVPTNVTAGRLQGGPRSVAQAEMAPIEDVAAQDGVLFNDALLFQEDNARYHRRRGDPQAGRVVEYAASTQAFVSIFEDSATPTAAGDVRNSRSRGLSNLISRAINTYEANDQIIHGPNDKRGATLSLVL